MAMLAMFVSIRQSAAVKKSEYFEMFITYIQHVVLNTISHTMNPLMFLSFSVPGFPRSIGPSVHRDGICLRPRRHDHYEFVGATRSWGSPVLSHGHGFFHGFFQPAIKLERRMSRFKSNKKRSTPCFFGSYCCLDMFRHV